MRRLLAGITALAGLVGLIGLAASRPGGAARAVRAVRAADTRSAHPAAPRCTPAHLNASAAVAGGRLTVSPTPQSRDASAETQISLLGVPAAELSAITVTGSRSGSHRGRLLAYSQGDGASFVPAHPFAGGERVQVRGRLRSASGTTAFAWSFTVAVRDTAGEAGGSSPRPPDPHYYQHFHSRPDLLPPTVTVTAHSPSASAGDLFLAPYSGPGQYGPMILDGNGSLVWFKPLAQGTRAADFRVQQYDGAPALTWWQDPLVSGGSSKAGGLIANGAYRQVAIVRAGNGYQPDLHEFQLTPRSTALITVYNGIDCDLVKARGSRNAAVVDTLIQELDVKTGLVRFEWHSLDHVSLAESYASARHSSQTTPFDYFHVNSVDVQHDGSLLIDARNTWAAYDVDARTGRVRWRLGGKRSTFAMGPGTRTAWQHDARQQPDGTITLFDNGATPSIHPQSRAIDVSLDLQTRSVSLVRSVQHAAPLVAGSQGNVQALAAGDWMVGWGEVPYLTEYGPGGEVLFDAHLPAAYESYRAYRLPWVGHPGGAPSLARAAGAHGATTLYASWNGATEVAAWRVLSGPSRAALKAVRDAPRSGFETAISLPAGRADTYVAVQALDSAGRVIGASAALKA
jgi:hypothetical protein